PFPEGSLFERAAHFATAGNFTKIVQTAPELAFRPCTAGESEHCDQGQERKGNSHKCFDVATNLMRFAKLVKRLLKKVHARSCPNGNAQERRFSTCAIQH